VTTLPPLADTADLPDQWASSPKAARALAVASSAIREAAGSPISQVTATVTVDGGPGRLLKLPGPLIRGSVTSVLVDGQPTSRYRVVAEGLWREDGWLSYLDVSGSGYGSGYSYGAPGHRPPAEVAVTYTFGLSAVPDDIVDLCAQLAVAWLQHDAAGGGSNAGVQAVRLDDAQETYTAEAAGQVSPVFIPEITCDNLAARFGAGGAVVVQEIP
jgi:hypothetical protein